MSRQIYMAHDALMPPAILYFF